MPTPSLYRERLSPPAWLFAVLLLIIPAVLAVFIPISLTWGWIVAVFVYGVVVVTLWVSAPVLETDGTQLLAGRARIPLTALGAPELLEGTSARDAMHTKWDARAFHVTVPWTPAIVRVAVNDDEDPTTAWLMSTRRPDVLAAALAR